jgi:hypothetical protein
LRSPLNSISLDGVTGMEWGQPLPEAIAANRKRATELARAVLAGELGLIEAAPGLVSALQGLRLTMEDPTYSAFVLIWSETETLPIGPQREHWAPDALARLEPRVAHAREWAKRFGLPACQQVIERFGEAASSSASSDAV